MYFIRGMDSNITRFEEVEGCLELQRGQVSYIKKEL